MKHIASATIAGTGPLLLLLAVASPAVAQSTDAAPREQRRTRITLGPQVNPRYPGADSYRISPFGNIDRARGDDPFAFEASDESTGLMLLDIGKLQIGPALNFQGSRRRRDTDGALPRVGFTVEAGGAMQIPIGPALRLRAEARQGIGGHKGLIGSLSADYIARDADDWVFSVGPRLSLSNGRYQRAYFGVAPADVLASNLSAFRPKGGIHAVGVSTSLVKHISGPWGVFGFARYDRLVDDAARSPVVRTYGSRNQLSGGLALSYTFGR